MARRLGALLLCVGLLPCVPSRAGDDSKDLAALLSRADVVARGFRGEFETFRGEDRPDEPLDFRTDGLKREFKGRLWVKGDDALVEFLGDPGMTPPGWNGRYKNVVQALAASKNETFDFTAIGSTAAPYANLRVYAPDQPEWVRNRIDSQVLDYLNALSTINGFQVESLLTSAEAVVKADPAKGRYSITARHNDAKNPSTITYDLTISDQTVSCSSKLTTGPAASVIIIETMAEGEIQGETIIPRRVARRISAPAWGDMGPGLRDVTREVALFTPKDLEPAPFPISSDFFKKYERPYSVIQGDAGQSRWFFHAKRLTVLAFAGLLAASGLVLWLRSQRSRAGAKKPKGETTGLE